MKGFIKVHTKYEEVIINVSTIQTVVEDKYQCFSSRIQCDKATFYVTETVQEIGEMIKEAST